MPLSVIFGVTSLRHLPPSAQKIYSILHSNDSMRLHDIESLTSYSSRMIRYALRCLMNAQLVSRVNGLWHYSFAVNR
ncbi:MAG: hypothetical protein ACFFB5_20805 [Promethearchaeota archaeon]